ncbi:protein of unknown function [Paenibacillus alvei]|uniref:Uncharacterized protein n=1 Tax=Paenibacillus alvei TaxID=44250 RepID=A0A383R3K2_PAEAL|nr:protein of unknown function [Paenibacillus alvei]
MLNWNIPFLVIRLSKKYAPRYGQLHRMYGGDEKQYEENEYVSVQLPTVALSFSLSPGQHESVL